MAALTPTLVLSQDSSAGTHKTKAFTVTPSTPSDTIDLSAFFDSIKYAKAWITGGMDAALQSVQISFVGTDITLDQKNAAGADASDWTGAEIHIEAVGTDEGV